MVLPSKRWGTPPPLWYAFTVCYLNRNRLYRQAERQNAVLVDKASHPGKSKRKSAVSSVSLYEVENAMILSQSAALTALSSERAFGFAVQLVLPADTAMKQYRKKASLRGGRCHLR